MVVIYNDFHCRDLRLLLRAGVQQSDPPADLHWRSPAVRHHPAQGHAGLPPGRQVRRGDEDHPENITGRRGRKGTTI